MSLNKWSGIGRLVGDVRSGMTKNDKAWASFRIAVDEDFTPEGQEKRTLFVNISTFGKLAEICAKVLGKGRLVYVDGRLEENSYEKEDGTTIMGFQIMADKVQFLDRAPEGEGSQQVGSAPKGKSAGVPF